jgi:hypothetical protein
MAYNAVKAWQKANKGNATVQAAANDLFYNAAMQNIGTRGSVDYANQMSPVALRYQAASTKIAEEADLRRLGAETSAARGVIQQQGDLNYRDNRLTAETRRYEADRDFDKTAVGAKATMYGADRSVDIAKEQTRAQSYESDNRLRGTAMETAAARYVGDRGVDSTRLTADASKYGADRGLEGIKDSNRSSEDQIRISGRQDRKTLTQGTDETLRLRADARGAIQTAGKSFYG